MSKCLMLGDAGGRLSSLEHFLKQNGFTAVPAPADAEWFCAREAGQGLSLIGAGEGCLRALLLAERYPVDQLLLIGCPLRPRGASPLRRRAEHNLFCVVCDLLVVQPLADATMLPRGADVLLRGVNSRLRRRVDLGRDFDDLWTNCKQPLADAVLSFLRAESNTKTLARGGDSW